MRKSIEKLTLWARMGIPFAQNQLQSYCSVTG
jgi:hypothetical protein